MSDGNSRRERVPPAVEVEGTSARRPQRENLLVHIGGTVKPKNEFKEGGIVVFRSTTLDLIPAPSGNDNTNINIMHGESFLLHISIRRRENTFVLNSIHANDNCWGPEVRKPLVGAFQGKHTTVTVYDHGDRFQILIDNHTLHYYMKKIPGTADSFSYNVDTFPPPFSKTLTVTTYNSFAGIAAAGEVDCGN